LMQKTLPKFKDSCLVNRNSESRNSASVVDDVRGTEVWRRLERGGSRTKATRSGGG